VPRQAIQNRRPHLPCSPGTELPGIALRPPRLDGRRLHRIWMLRRQPPNRIPLQSSAATATRRSKSAWNWVFLNVSVRDRYSNPEPPDLAEEDFEIYEDRSPPRCGLFETAEFALSSAPAARCERAARKLHRASRKRPRFNSRTKINANDRIGAATFNSNVRLIRILPTTAVRRGFHPACPFRRRDGVL